METSSVGCRLCLDPFADNFDSIDNLKEQMDKVFQFVIECRPGCSTTVCQSCSYTVCEFYKYSEKVRVNQVWLAGGTFRTSDSPAGDFKTVLAHEDVKPDPIIPNSVVEVIQGEVDFASADDKPQLITEKPDNSVPVADKPELKDESEAEPEFDQYPSDDSYKPPVKTTKTVRKRQRQSKTPSSEDSGSSDSEDDVESKRPKRQRKREPKSEEQKNQEDQTIKEFYRLMCDLCSYVGEDFRSVFQHYREEHKKKGFIVCCKKKLSSRKMLLNHITYHKNPNAFRCDQCNKCYKNLEYLEMHKSNIHLNQNVQHPFKCDECDKTYPKKYQLKMHKDTHKTIQCQICNKILSSSSTLNAHMANMHSEKNRIMVCDFCGQEFLNKASFDRHLNEHNGIEVPKLQCQFCKRWYRGERNLTNHIEYVHNQREKGAQFPCDICHQNYPNERAMKKHKRYVHVEEKFECEFCGKRFKQSFNLKEHRTTHTGEVLYSCDYCGITKNSRANLYVHVKQKHPAEWIEQKRREVEANATL